MEDNTATDPRTVARLRPFGETVFASMSRRAAATGAINLGQGYPDWDGPREVLEEAANQILGGNNQYAPGNGDAGLRRAVCADRERRLGQRWNPDTECLVTVGATEAITAAVLGLVEPGSRIVLIEPYYDSYRAAAALVDAEVAFVPLRSDGDSWRLDCDALREAVTDATAMIIVNTPHNPTGSLLDAAELAVVAEAAIRHDCLVLSDEVYEHLLYDGRSHASVSELPGMRERTVVVSSAAKTFNITGWKTGWALAPAELLAGVRAAKQFLSYVGATPVQPAVAKALDSCGDWVADLREELGRNKSILVSGLRELGLEVHDAHAGYFVVADISPLGLGDAMETCMALPEAAGVAAIPVTAFVDDPESEPWRNLVRFGFCKRESVITEALARLRAFMEEKRGAE